MTTRVSRYGIPSEPSRCMMVRPCVYRDGKSMCDDPRTNKGNSDSTCHTLSNKSLSSLLQKEKPNAK